MATECPKCGELIPDDARARAGRARWAGVSAKDRSEAARRASGARWQKSKEARLAKTAILPSFEQ